MLLVGIFIGGTLPWIASITMTAVGDAAMEMIEEIRRQFREISGLMEGTAEQTMESVSRSLPRPQENDLARLIAVSAPPVVVILGPEALGGMLAGGLLGCVLALMMANAGGAWDNAKFVERGNFGGKGSEVHAAAVVGDTVGDPFRIPQAHQ